MECQVGSRICILILEPCLVENIYLEVVCIQMTCKATKINEIAKRVSLVREEKRRQEGSYMLQTGWLLKNVLSAGTETTVRPLIC